MEYKLMLLGRLPGLNEYIAANRQNPYKGAKMKKDNEAIVICAIRQQLRGVKIDKPVRINFMWYEKDRRRDHDNVSSFGRKVIQDALVAVGVLQNDGWNEIIGFSDGFAVDKANPRIEIIITEV